MRVTLDPAFRLVLALIPEQGMGFQLVDVYFEDGRMLEGLPAFDGQEVDVPTSYAGVKIVGVRSMFEGKL